MNLIDLLVHSPALCVALWVTCVAALGVLLAQEDRRYAARRNRGGL